MAEAAEGEFDLKSLDDAELVEQVHDDMYNGLKAEWRGPNFVRGLVHTCCCGCTLCSVSPSHKAPMCLSYGGPSPTPVPVGPPPPTGG